jgi:hypothetical protein
MAASRILSKLNDDSAGKLNVALLSAQLGELDEEILSTRVRYALVRSLVRP